MAEFWQVATNQEGRSRPAGPVEGDLATGWIEQVWLAAIEFDRGMDVDLGKVPADEGQFDDEALVARSGRSGAATRIRRNQWIVPAKSAAS